MIDKLTQLNSNTNSYCVFNKPNSVRTHFKSQHWEFPINQSHIPPRLQSVSDFHAYHPVITLIHSHASDNYFTNQFLKRSTLFYSLIRFSRVRIYLLTTSTKYSDELLLRGWELSKNSLNCNDKFLIAGLNFALFAGGWSRLTGWKRASNEQSWDEFTHL